MGNNHQDEEVEKAAVPASYGHNDSFSGVSLGRTGLQTKPNQELLNPRNGSRSLCRLQLEVARLLCIPCKFYPLSSALLFPLHYFVEIKLHRILTHCHYVAMEHS